MNKLIVVVFIIIGVFSLINHLNINNYDNKNNNINTSDEYNTTDNYKNIYVIAKELSELKIKGDLIHSKFNNENDNDIIDCVKEYGHLRDKTKKLINKINNINSISYRSRLLIAANDTFACLYCGGDGNSCKNIQPVLDEVFDLLKKEHPEITSMDRDTIIDINGIVKKDKATVDETIGPPDSCENIKYGSKCIYKNGKFEIVYINGLSDWISVNDLKDIPYQPDSIRFFGLEPSRPSFSNEFETRWENTYGLLSIKFSPGENNMVDFAYIKATTP